MAHPQKGPVCTYRQRQGPHDQNILAENGQGSALEELPESLKHTPGSPSKPPNLIPATLCPYTFMARSCHGPPRDTPE